VAGFSIRTGRRRSCEMPCRQWRAANPRIASTSSPPSMVRPNRIVTRARGAGHGSSTSSSDDQLCPASAAGGKVQNHQRGHRRQLTGNRERAEDRDSSASLGARLKTGNRLQRAAGDISSVRGSRAFGSIAVRGYPQPRPGGCSARREEGIVAADCPDGQSDGKPALRSDESQGGSAVRRLEGAWQRPLIASGQEEMLPSCRRVTGLDRPRPGPPLERRPCPHASMRQNR
jgi:hypothetical protein